ncbi:MAG TPA: DUF882 domain-containing protein [Polyangia bacterium]|nr:DUF882 domain-containing protein [Polyangia bacterium]
MRRAAIVLALALAWLSSAPCARADAAPRVALDLDGDEEPPSKKTGFLREKLERKDVRLAKAPRAAADKVLTLHNVWTNESLPIVDAPGAPPAPTGFDELVRCHFTNQAISMDQRLLQAIRRAAAKFNTSYVEIVSGFRAPKYQLMLRKKGHEVARDSEHPRGHAVDFRIPEVPTNVLLRFVRSLKLGGVGYYPDSKFVHCDVGRVRFWRGH